jgi:hypothetical protein
MADGAFSGSIIPSLLSLRTAFPETVFTDPSRVIYKDRISLTKNVTVPERSVQGYAMVTKDGHLESDRMTTVAEWAKKNGWTSSPLLDADGATGSIWGYAKEMKEGTQALIIQSHIRCANAPTDCEKEHREVVFMSDPLKK